MVDELSSIYYNVLKQCFVLLSDFGLLLCSHYKDLSHLSFPILSSSYLAIPP
jgi:hypothetical protein